LGVRETVAPHVAIISSVIDQLDPEISACADGAGGGRRARKCHQRHWQSLGRSPKVAAKPQSRESDKSWQA